MDSTFITCDIHLMAYSPHVPVYVHSLSKKHVQESGSPVVSPLGVRYSHIIHSLEVVLT